MKMWTAKEGKKNGKHVKYLEICLYYSKKKSGNFLKVIDTLIKFILSLV